MAQPTAKELQAIVDDLQLRNSELEQQLGTVVVRTRRHWSWTILATVLIVVGSLLAPAAVLANWTQAELTSTDTFVDTFAPLAGDPDVQALIVDQVAVAINGSVDIGGLTGQLFDGIDSLGLSPAASASLGALEGVTVQGIHNLIETTITKLVASPAFASVFEQTLRTTHEQLIATLQSSPDTAIALMDNGEVGIQLAPIIASVKDLLVAQGFGFAQNIPVIDKTIVIAQSDQLAQAQQAYSLTVTVGVWAPWLVIALLLAGVLVARRRSIALIWASVALAFVMILMVTALDVGKLYVIPEVTRGLVPAAVADMLFSQVTQYTRNSAIAVATIAIAIAIVAWFSGSSTLARRLRRAGGAVAGSGHGLADRYGLSTGAFGAKLYSARLAVRIAIAAIAAVVVVFVRPLTIQVIVTTAILAIVLLVISELVQRPPVESAS